MKRTAIRLGTMNFGKRTPADESERILRRALELDIRHFDTANVYNDGESERILGRVLGPARGTVEIATKVGLARAGGAAEGLSRAAVERAIDESLGRLATDYVDLYYLHAPDHRTPIEETMDALARLFETKKIRAWGVSNYASWQILEMNALADARRMPRPATSQVLYNLLIREIEIEYLGFTKRFPIHTTVYNPLAGGLLSGRYRPEEFARPPERRGTRFEANKMYRGRYWSARMFELTEALKPVAQGEGMTLVELAYAWVAGRPGVDSVLVGPTTVAQLDAAVDACKKGIPETGLTRIDVIWAAHTGTDTHYVR
jgi:aryl-alcohol dehydrogenase-like predicted oxidoreductase